MTTEMMQQAVNQFNFTEQSIETMTLDTLRRTFKENDTEGIPVKGIYHYQVIERVEEICRRHNVKYEVEEIFAAQNRNKNTPGVVILPQVEEKFGERAVEAHILRRIYTTIRIKEEETDELTTSLVVAFHQSGIQMAIGPCVRVCHNQCILSPERIASNFGKQKVSTEQLFECVDDWLANLYKQMEEDRKKIERLKKKILTPLEVYAYIGLLTTLRVSHDSSDKRLSCQVETYPLNQAQISDFTEELLKLALDKKPLSAWDIYNVATEIYKPGRMEIPVVIPQNAVLAELLLSDDKLNA